MSNNEIDALAINESRIDSTVPNDMISMYGYSWVGKNKNIDLVMVLASLYETQLITVLG